MFHTHLDFLEDETMTKEQALKEYVEFLEERYGAYYNNELKYIRLNMPSVASYWEGFKVSTLATINDLKDILGENK